MHEGELRKGFQHSTLREIEKNKREEEEERRGNKAEALPNHDCDQSLRHFSLRVLRLSFD